MKQLMFFLFLSLPFMGMSQTIAQSLNFSKIGWRIDIPSGYKISDTLSGAATWDKEVKDRSGSSIYPYNSLFSIVDYRHSFLGAYLIPFKSKKDGAWPVFIQRNNEKWYAMLKNDDIQTDTVSGAEIISGIRFEKFSINRKMAGKLLSGSILLNTQVGGYCLRIYLSYPDNESREQLLAILRRSGFIPIGNSI